MTPGFRFFLSVIVVLFAGARNAVAGSNAGGTLIVHGDPAVVYTVDHGSYCADADLSSCEDANTSIDATEPRVIWVLAAFHELSSPRLAGLTFGIEYPVAFTILDSGMCGEFELPMSAWPSSGTGTAVTFDPTRTEDLVPVYWIAGYTYNGSGLLETIPHPTQGGNFANDDVGGHLDPIAGYSAMGLGELGELVCPVTPGACCVGNVGVCEIVPRELCHGEFLGEGVGCTPNPCTPTGACCFEDGSCSREHEIDCNAMYGSYQGDGSDCDPDPCPQSTGACCTIYGECIILAAPDCVGHYQGDDVPCDPSPCPPAGACCFHAGCQKLTEQACGDGLWLGEGVFCETSPCPPIGACCGQQGGCLVTFEQECIENYGGYWQGPEVPCEPDPCPPSGACCFPGGGCSVFPELYCVEHGGTWRGAGVPCESDTCPVAPAACCFTDGSCMVLPRGECDDLGGTHLGEGVACDPSPCVGACCLPDLTCKVMSEQDCVDVFGLFHGIGEPCHDGLCSTVPIHEESWGQIKRRYGGTTR